jgi:hypothetical protein
MAMKKAVAQWDCLSAQSVMVSSVAMAYSMAMVFSIDRKDPKVE